MQSLKLNYLNTKKSGHSRFQLQTLDIQKYRPISALHFLKKIFEKVIYNKLFEFINANNILYEKQFGFRQGHATSHAIMTLVGKVSKALDTGKIVVCIYLDRRKAFDSISTSILLDKLYKIRIHGNLYCLLQSHLSPRTQYVVYNKYNSSTQSIEYKLPQGSILWPLLFILFKDDFSKASKLNFTILFADATSVFL